jgi:hypothetical protein
MLSGCVSSIYLFTVCQTPQSYTAAESLVELPTVEGRSYPTMGSVQCVISDNTDTLRTEFTQVAP